MASLRAALTSFPVLLAPLPDRPGTVDALLLWAYPSSSVLKGPRVVRQAAFTGAQEVKA